MVQQLETHLAGDAGSLFLLHMALGRFEEAADAAAGLARAEQEAGNYKVGCGR